MKLLDRFKQINIVSKYFTMKKQVGILMDGMLRPSTNKGFFAQSVHLYPAFPYNTFYLYDLAYNSDVLTTIHNALRRELFRNGFDLIEAEDVKEDYGSSESQTIPKGKTREEILRFLEKVNKNQQSIIDVFSEMEDDFSIMDDVFLVFMFNYVFDNGKLIQRELKEILRGDPRFMGPLINKFGAPAYNDDNIPLYFCPFHRENLLEGEEVCKLCGTETWLAYFFKDTDGKKAYYSNLEVVYRNKYRPSIRRGFPMVITVWQKVRTLLFMDNYMMTMYDGKRPPKHGLFFKTSNQDSLQKAIEEAKKKVEENPHWPLIMAIPDTSNGQKFVEFIDFMRSLVDLQHVEMRNELRRQIGACYGVEPIFQADQSQSGGLNNEGLQITVTNRAVEYGQSIYNQHFFPRILEAMGAEGWILRLNPSEEQDEMAKLDREQRSLQNGQLALSLGLEAEYDDDTGEVTIKSGKLEKQEVTAPLPFEKPISPSRPSGTPAISKIDELSKAKRRPYFSRMSDTIKREIEKLIKGYRRKISEEELKKLMAQVNLKLQKNIKESTEKLFKDAYQREMMSVEKERGINLFFNTVDENALVALASQNVLSEAYSGISNELVNKLNEIIREAYREPEGLTIRKITEKIQDAVDISDFRSENIARTETSKISMAARKNSYAKEGDFEVAIFKHIGPDDNRTTDTSKRIKARTNEGVNWEEYVKIVEEESAKDFPEWTVNKDFPVSHYSSRHSFIRIG